jgi:nicotinate-nucleotide adenylyltransferase
MKIGILGGTFSPPTLAHIWLAQQVLEDEKLDEVWVVPNNSSEHYGKRTKVSAEDRLFMCQLMVKDFENPNIIASNVEIRNKIIYTYQLADYTKSNFPGYKFHLILGGDWDITVFRKWEHIKKIFKIIQVHRPDVDDNETSYYESQNIQFDLSSSIIRERISKGQTINGLVTPSVKWYIDIYKLYKKGK